MIDVLVSNRLSNLIFQCQGVLENSTISHKVLTSGRLSADPRQKKLGKNWTFEDANKDRIAAIDRFDSNIRRNQRREISSRTSGFWLGCYATRVGGNEHRIRSFLYFWSFLFETKKKAAERKGGKEEQREEKKNSKVFSFASTLNSYITKRIVFFCWIFFFFRSVFFIFILFFCFLVWESYSMEMIRGEEKESKNSSFCCCCC